jgi:hypothetical protein
MAIEYTANKRFWKLIVIAPKDRAPIITGMQKSQNIVLGILLAIWSRRKESYTSSQEAKVREISSDDKDGCRGFERRLLKPR